MIRYVAALIMLMMLPACQGSVKPPVAINNYCLVAVPVKPSRQDVLTLGTKQAIAREIVKYKELCETSVASQ